MLELVVVRRIPPWHLHADAPEPFSLSSSAADVSDQSLHYEGQQDAKEEAKEQAGALDLGLPIEVQQASITC